MWYEAGHPENILLFAVAALSAAALVLLPLKGASSKHWRVVDLIILAIGAFGLYAATFESDKEISSRLLQLNYSPQAIKFRWEFDVLLPLKMSATSGCTPSKRSPYSPENFDEIEKLRNQLCEWVKNVRLKFVDPQSVDNPAPIPLTVMDDFPDWIPGWRDVVGFNRLSLEHDLKGWNSYATKYSELRARINNDPDAGNARIEGPYLLALAFAIAIIKIFYERRD